MINPRSMSFRWFLLAAFFVVTVVGIAWPRLPYKTETVDICSISGSVSRETVTFGIFRETAIEPTPLLNWIRIREPDFVPEYEPWCTYRTYLFSVRRSCSQVPPVALLRAVQEDLLDEILADRISALVSTFRREDREKQIEEVTALLDEVRR